MAHFKLVFLLVCVASYVLEIKGNREMFKKVRECAQEADVKKEDMHEAMIDWNFTENMKCFTACLLKAKGMMSPDGKMYSKDEAQLSDSKHKEDLEMALEKCSSSANDEGKETCESAFQFALCAYKESWDMMGEQQNE